MEVPVGMIVPVVAFVQVPVGMVVPVVVLVQVVAPVGAGVPAEA